MLNLLKRLVNWLFRRKAAAQSGAPEYILVSGNRRQAAVNYLMSLDNTEPVADCRDYDVSAMVEELLKFPAYTAPIVVSFRKPAKRKRK